MHEHAPGHENDELTVKQDVSTLEAAGEEVDPIRRTAEALRAVDSPAAYFEVALNFAALLEKTDPDAYYYDDTDYGSVIKDIALQQIAAGEKMAALETAKHISNRDREDVYSVLIAKQTEQGDFDAAFDIVDGIEDFMMRQSLHKDIGVAMARRGDIAAAEVVADELTYDHLREDVRTAIVDAHLATGDIAAAKAATTLLAYPVSHEQCLVRIARSQVASGDATAALETAETIQDLPVRTEAQMMIALDYAGRGDRSSEEALMSQIETQLADTTAAVREHADRVIVQALAGAGEFERASAYEARIDNRFIKDDLHAMISRAQALQGDFAGAVATAEAAATSFRRVDELGDIAVIAATAGNLDEALTLATTIKDTDEGDRAFAVIAAEKAHRGEIDAARDVIATAEGLYILEDRALAYAALAVAEAKAGNFERAQTDVANIFSREQRLRTQIEICELRVLAGDVTAVRREADFMGASEEARLYAAIGALQSKSAPTPEDVERIAGLQSNEASLHVANFWSEIARDSTTSLVFARHLQSPEQLLAMMYSFDRLIDTESLTPTEKAEVMTGFLRDVWQTRYLKTSQDGAEDTFYSGSAGEVVEKFTDSDAGLENFTDAFRNGLGMTEILERPWLLDPVLQHPEVPFPRFGGRAEQYRYLADHSFTDLAGFNRSTMGRLIYSRLENGLEPNVHDATQWLETFHLSLDTLDGAYDVSRIKENNVLGVTTNLQAVKVPLWREQDAINFLIGVKDLPPDQSFRLPGASNPAETVKYEDLLWQPAHMLIYRLLLEHPDILDVQTYSDMKVAAALQPYIEDYWAARDQAVATRKDQPVRPESRDDLEAQLWRVLGDIRFPEGSEPVDSPSKSVAKLRTYAKNRKAYVDDATSWLMRHADTPETTLTKAWQNRPLALAEGVPDRATAINAWADTNALRIEAARLADEHGMIENPAVDEPNKRWFDTRRLDGDLAPFTAELSRCYGAEATLDALMLYDARSTKQADFPATQIELDDGFRFEILAKNDPRGFSIGFDTGCCMTLDGASEDCIWAGYTDPRYAFAALYGPDGRLQAQSLLYHNPEEAEKTLIIDNIEANRGRDLRRVRRLYQQALRRYLSEDGAANGVWNNVHVGEGYTDVNLDDLPVAPVVKGPKESVYTDAYHQRLLLDLQV